MELDFSRLNKLPFQMFDTAEAEEAQVETKEVNLETEKAKVEPEQVNFKRENKVAVARLNIEKENQRKLNEMYGAYSENRAKASDYIAQLLNGARAGEKPAKLLLTACKCISAMTGEKVFLEQIEGDIKAIYGVALQDIGALEIEREDVQKRLQKLQEAYRREETTPEEKKRIDSAIKAHKARLEHLGGLQADLDIMF